ncbi:hypothetical protein Tco_1005982 [Tanacetum coccineum]|uniref:Uncharacterized protein n=1 Tax=Tanacetum coccineum TaxID=301880 RepID=A0ABQ5FHK0_9ASTR
MHENKSFNRNPANHALYHALMEALIEDENAMDKGGKKTKRRRTKEPESSKKTSTTRETPKGKAPSKGSKTGKSTSTKEPVKELIAEVAMDDAVNTTGEEVASPNSSHASKLYLIKPEQPWFIQMVSATKNPLTFNDLMATPSNFYKYVLSRLKIDNLTQDLLLGPAYNMLKGTCFRNIELEYNFQECFNALTDKLD